MRNQYYAASLVDHGVMRLADHGDVKEVDTVAASAAEDMDTWLIGEREGKGQALRKIWNARHNFWQLR